LAVHSLKWFAISKAAGFGDAYSKSTTIICYSIIQISIAKGRPGEEKIMDGRTNLVVLGFTLFHAVQAEYIAVLSVVVTQNKVRINVGSFDPFHVALPLYLKPV
jgi:hypothetical protein